MCKTIKQKVKFKITPRAVYDLLVDPKKHSALTGKKANVSEKAGTPFSTYGGEFTGITVDTSKGKRIVQAWRERKFPPGIFSMATINLTPTKTGTQLVLTHRGVPKDLIPGVENQWRKKYWDKIRKLTR
jgi:activator of HSP90 ATPase